MISLLATCLTACKEEEVKPTSVKFTRSEFTAGESDGIISLGIQLDQPTKTDIVINLAFSGTATVGVDYTIPETTTTIKAGETNGSFKIDLKKDIVFEGDEIIDVSISSSGGVASSGTYKVTIKDDDCDFNWLGALAGYDVDVDKDGGKFTAAVTIAKVGTSYTINGLNVAFMQGYWGETVIRSNPVTFTVDDGGAITIAKQAIFTTLYAGDEYPYEIIGSGQVNTCDANVTINYDVITGGFAVGKYLHDQRAMTDLIFKAVLKP